MEFGTDCSTDITLKAMQKDFTWDKVVHSNNLFTNAGISCSHFIIFGGPEETEETAYQGLRNLEDLKGSVIFASIGIRVFPDTPVHSYLIRNKLINENKNLLEPYFFVSPSTDFNFLDRILAETFKNSKDRIYNENDDYVERSKAFHLFGHRGPVWDYILKTDKNLRKRY